MKSIVGTALLGLFLASGLPALADSALDSTAATGKLGGFGHSDWQGTQNNYNQSNTFGWNGGHHELAPQGWADYTNTQGAAAPNGPRLTGSPSFASGPWGQSGAVTSAPFAGTNIAPGNMALRQVGRVTLPPTQLTSFVKDSGMNDAIYGDEGTDDKPPVDNFTEEHRIEAGMGMNVGLTTGHKCSTIDCPPAWGYPQ
ncbi:MAG: hypothetical protein K2X81_17140 [Candidatus Obscuribacterales bacterium]|nr:hypothetical protein [Candidatus Obscuribacterales bacterium]